MSYVLYCVVFIFIFSDLKVNSEVLNMFLFLCFKVLFWDIDFVIEGLCECWLGNRWVGVFIS